MPSVLVTLLAVTLAAVAPAAGLAVVPATTRAAAPTRTPAPAGPTLAKEDTMYTQVPEVLVRAPRVTLDEILDRVARGEARRESLMVDQAFTATVRLVRSPRNGKPASLIEETVTRVFRKRPGRVRSMLLRRWQEKPDKDGDAVEADFSADMGERVVNFAFQPGARRDFRYRILGRDLVGDHLIYRIAFEPRSPLDPTQPSGTVWIDTNDFVIVRQEVRFDRSPVPLLIKDLDHMVVERQRVAGYWVLKRILLRIAFTVPLPTVGSAFDMALQFDDYAINQGIDDAFFGPAAASAPGQRVRVRVGHK